jgi:hypothetical protein
MSIYNKSSLILELYDTTIWDDQPNQLTQNYERKSLEETNTSNKYEYIILYILYFHL